MTKEDHNGIELEYLRDYALIRFNRPATRNSLSRTTLDTLDSLFSLVSEQPAIKSILFTGIEDVFASGADLREIAALDQEKAAEFSRRGQDLFQRIASSTKATVAAVNGYCIGGALDLALACDLRVAASSAVFAHPGASLGIITGWGGTQRLPRLIGRARAAEMFFTARRISAVEAKRIGLVREIGDPVLDLAVSFLPDINQKVADESATS